MLNHGHIAVGRLLFNVDFVFFNVAEFHLLVLFGFCVHGRARECHVKRRLSLRFVAIAHKLQVQLGRHGLATGVDDVVANVQVIGATLERVSFDQLKAAYRRGLKFDFDLVLPGL